MFAPQRQVGPESALGNPLNSSDRGRAIFTCSEQGGGFAGGGDKR